MRTGHHKSRHFHNEAKLFLKLHIELHIGFGEMKNVELNSHDLEPTLDSHWLRKN